RLALAGNIGALGANGFWGSAFRSGAGSAIIWCNMPGSSMDPLANDRIIERLDGLGKDGLRKFISSSSYSTNMNSLLAKRALRSSSNAAGCTESLTPWVEYASAALCRNAAARADSAATGGRP